MISRFTKILIACMTITAHVPINADFSGYAKSFAVAQDGIDTPIIQSDRLYQAQNSIRLMWQRFGAGSTWQLHYEVSPVLNSAAPIFDNATFGTVGNSYRLTDPEALLNNEGEKHQLFQNLDRFNLQFNLDFGDLTIGRQAIAFGSARVINPTDVFLPFDVRTFDQEYRIGVDAVRFQYPFGQLGEVDLGIVLGDGARSENSAAFARVRENINGFDLQFSLIRFAGQNLVGGGLQSSLWNAGTWFEAARVTGEVNYWRASVGIDYAFTENIFGMIEYHYNGAGTDDSDNYLSRTGTLPYRQGGVFLLGEDYLIPVLSWQVTALWSVNLQSLYNLNDKSAFIAITAQFNAAENFYMDFGYYHFRGDELSEISPGVPLLKSEYGTNPDTLFASLKYYF